MPYYVLAALITAVMYAGVVWYFAGQVHYVIQDQQYADPFYKWEQIKHYMATPLVVFYLLAAVWFVLAGMQFGLFGRISSFYDTMAFNAGSILTAGGFAIALVLLAALPAAACVWLEGWLERKYRSDLPGRGDKSWHRASLTVVP